ncbi:uncharacterized protein IL334_004341 [Kwoniella shivajii]|uniref:PUM-HD domain-containing protein n=1 Tax=Kwoniella shivajii TaxID=564305 RepID=A0ABZ1D1T7_9TREE|nr:hypothetical protein IL334_004341 [Kwoniella shivajii]
MSGQGQYDSAGELAARIGGLGITSEEAYSSPQQPNPHNQSPFGNNYASIQSPTSRVSLQTQPYSPYGNQQGYPYYGNTDSTYDATGNPAATYGYVAPTPEVSNLNSQPSLSSYDTGFSTSREVYNGQHDHRQVLTNHQQQNTHENSPLGQQGLRITRQPFRSQPGQSAYQQAATMQQQVNAAAVAAGYYSYQDPRGFWSTQGQNMYMPQSNDRKKEGNSYNTRNQQSPYSFRSNQQNVNNSHFGYNDSTTPTLGTFPMTAVSTNPYVANQQNTTSLFQLSPAQGYPGLAGYQSQAYQNAAGFVLRSRRHEDSGVIRSALLEDFRLNKIRKWELRDIFGHIVEFSGDQHGSRFIQQKLETATLEDRQNLFDEIMPNARQLMTDVFGNYVTQKLFEHGDQRQKATLAKQMEHHVFSLSNQTYGCRVVQKAFEHVLVDQRQTLVSELEGHVLECVKSSNANHVIQRLIMLGPPQSIPDAFIGSVEELAKHPYGCRVIQKMFENLPEEMKRTLLNEMHEHTIDLMEDQFGNYVVQSVIVVGDATDRDKIIQEIKGRVTNLARHKFASNVVEKAILKANDQDRRILIDELVGLKDDGSSQVGMLLRDAFGNFPLQTALLAASSDQRQELLKIINPIIPQIRNTPVGKRLENRLNQFEADGAIAHQSRRSVSSSLSTSDAGSGHTTPGGLTMSRSTSEDTGPTSPEPEPVNGLRAKSVTPKITNGKGKGRDRILEDLLQ